MALFEGKQNVHLYVRFLAKLGAPLSSELLNTLHIIRNSGEQRVYAHKALCKCQKDLQSELKSEK